MTLHVLELADGDDYVMVVTPDRSRFDRLAESVRADYPYPETVAIGTIESDSVETAIPAIIRGEWEYSQC